MNKRTALGAASLVAALTLAGCSAGESVDIDGADSVDGDVLIAAIGGEPDQLDPQRTSSYFAFEVLENVFDTLVAPDENLEMQPALAESWEVSDDQLTWTFDLRDGVTFHDGSEFTSEDVVYSYRRIIDEQLANAWKFAAITDIAAPDDDTVVITVAQPTPNLLSNLGGFKGMAIVQQENVESGDITTAPIGTGPFSVTGYSSGDRITLAANSDYWGGAPELAGLEYRFISEPATALAALRAGDIHWTDVVPPQQVSELESDDTVQLGLTPSSDYWYLALNEAREPWSDVRVRQALAYAIDRDAIVQAVSYGTAALNQLAIPEQSVWYTEYDEYSTDLDTAQALLDEAGFTGGTLDLLATSDYPETVTAAQIIASNLEPLGIDVEIRQPDFSTWLDEQNTGNFDMLMMGWLGNIDPDDFYYAQHHTDGASNAQKYSNAEVDALLDAGRIETDPEARKELYAEAATIIADEVSYIYLYNPSVIQVWSPDVTGYTTRADRAIRFDEASLAG
ncbi:ABC transporter substrate-binding protein [Microbacterium aurantiacum]|uniref:ABC transporter substrate-binding protein n=2 Tax=Microbacterium aurantiacum TaxID=162393 RepID=A0A0M8MHK2_9MICO|nr:MULTISPECIES: ABC transporter substrate-binding protein [Microbacterium]ANG84421.1 ABC transporter substrate-binding protein [Microbacterium chocolatum]KOS11648.1 ABC transporter substrate-binding protein [Microbacterium chocolatum]MDN4464967.1 ABC transporter substrate-binding protein [Microbacterium aurantiacum]